MEMTGTKQLRLISATPQRTEAIGAALGRRLQPADVICLSGTLGAGKTVCNTQSRTMILPLLFGIG
jgi:tRNA A37 threonylcarbamoyladenosine biosynthesis protein TsaE